MGVERRLLALLHAVLSRTTAYRYFATQQALLAAAHPETGAQSMLGENPPQDPAERLDRVITGFISMLLETEAQQRTMLRLSLQPNSGELPLRQGRAIRWITEALEPLREQFTDPGLHNLVLVIRSATGIEALVWLTDIAGLYRQEAAELMRWSARGLLHAALESGAPGEVHQSTGHAQSASHSASGHG